jgi:hypothetical protein
VEPAAVVGEGDEQPLGGNLLDAAQGKREKPMALLMMPKTGSTVCLRFL